MSAIKGKIRTVLLMIVSLSLASCALFESGSNSNKYYDTNMSEAEYAAMQRKLLKVYPDRDPGWYAREVSAARAVTFRRENTESAKNLLDIHRQARIKKNGYKDPTSVEANEAEFSATKETNDSMKEALKSSPEEQNSEGAKEQRVKRLLEQEMKKSQQKDETQRTLQSGPSKRNILTDE